MTENCGCYGINYFNSCAAISDFVFCLVYRTHNQVMKGKEKVKFYAQNEPFYLPIDFFSLCLLCFKSFYCVNPLNTNRALGRSPTQLYGFARGCRRAEQCHAWGNILSASHHGLWADTQCLGGRGDGSPS